METTLTSKGQITLPKAIRESLHLKNGDKIIFEENADGCYVLRPKTLSVTSLKGSLNYSGPVRTVEQMQQAIEKNAG